MKPRSLALLASTLVFFLSFFGLTWSVRRSLDQIEVVTVTSTIQPGVEIESGMVSLTRVNRGAVHPQAVRNPGEALGRVAQGILYPGEQLIRQRITPGTAAGANQIELLPHERGLAIPTDLVRSVGATLKPGDTVDVMAFPAASGEPRAEAILRSVRVIGIRNSRAAALGQKGDKPTPYDPVENLVPAAVILAVSPDDASRLLPILAREESGRGTGIFLLRVPPGGDMANVSSSLNQASPPGSGR